MRRLSWLEPAGLVALGILSHPYCAPAQAGVSQVAGTAAVDSAYITAIDRGDRRWFTGQYLAKSVGVVVHNVDGQQCLRRRVQFIPLTAAVGSGTEIKFLELRGQWDGKACAASMRWRMSDVPGQQRLQARLVRSDTVWVSDYALARTTADFTATAHAHGSVLIGAVYVPGGITGVSGGAPDEIEKKERSFQPVIGIDLPILLSVLPKPGFLDNVRGVLATSLRDIGSDLYVGIQLFPLLTGARGGAFPLQGSIGSRIGFKSHGNGFFIALHYNASGALSTALGLLK